MNRDERTKELWLDDDLHAYLSNVYPALAEPATLDMFRAMHRGFAVMAMQAHLDAHAQMSSAAPSEVSPWETRIWVPIQKSGPVLDLKWKPWDMTGIKSTLGPDGEDSTWVDFSYDRNTGRIVFAGGVPDGSYWIPEMRRENPWFWDVTAAASGVGREMRPGWYSPEHLPHWLRAIEAPMLKGLEREALVRAVNAAAGNPFSYASGTVTAVRSLAQGGWVVEVTDADGDVFACECPPGAWVRPELDPSGWKNRRYVGTAHLPQVGQIVTEFEPLCQVNLLLVEDTRGSDSSLGAPVMGCVRGGVIVVGQNVRGWERMSALWNQNPAEWGGYRTLAEMGANTNFLATETWGTWDANWDEESRRWGDGVELSTSLTGVGVRVRPINGGLVQSARIRRIAANKIWVDEALVDVKEAFVQLDSSAIAGVFSVRVEDRSGFGSRRAVELVANRARGVGLGANITYIHRPWESAAPWDASNLLWAKSPPHASTPWDELDIDWGFNDLVWG